MMHWATELIGKSYRPGAIGPDAFDCWGLVWYVYNYIFSLPVPYVPYHGGEKQAARRFFKKYKEIWEEIPLPELHCVVTFSPKVIPTHTGIYLGDRKVLHATEGVGVVVDPIDRFKYYGYRTIKFYRHRGVLGYRDPEPL